MLNYFWNLVWQEEHNLRVNAEDYLYPYVGQKFNEILVTYWYKGLYTVTCIHVLDISDVNCYLSFFHLHRFTQIKLL